MLEGLRSVQSLRMPAILDFFSKKITVSKGRKSMSDWAFWFCHHTHFDFGQKHMAKVLDCIFSRSCSVLCSNQREVPLCPHGCCVALNQLIWCNSIRKRGLVTIDLDYILCKLWSVEGILDDSWGNWHLCDYFLFFYWTMMNHQTILPFGGQQNNSQNRTKKHGIWGRNKYYSKKLLVIVQWEVRTMTMTFQDPCVVSTERT